MRLLRIMRLIKMMKMVKLVLSSGFAYKLRTVLGDGLLRLCYLAIVALMIVHWIACGFYYAAFLQQEDGSTWVGLANLTAAGT